MEPIQPICSFCEHKRRGTFCDAFPDGIPENILLSEVLHAKPIEGDSGIVFKPEMPLPDWYQEFLTPEQLGVLSRVEGALEE